MRLVTASGSPYGRRAEATSWNSSRNRISRRGGGGPPQRAVRGGAVGDHRRRQRLRELRGIGDPEQVDLRGVGPAPPRARHSGLTHARLPRAARPRDDQVGARLEAGGDLAHVVAPPDQLAGGYGRVGREEIAACLSHPCTAYTIFV